MRASKVRVHLALAAAVASMMGAVPARASEDPAELPEREEINPPWKLAESMVRLDRESVNIVRLGPGQEYSVLQVVPEGSQFEVLARRGDWYNVRVSDTQTGWVHDSLCTVYGDLADLEFRPNRRIFSRKGSWTATTYAGGYSFDRKSNSIALGGRLGYYVNDFMEVEGGASWTKISRPTETVDSLFDLILEEEKFHMFFYELNANFEILPGRQFVPYATVGIGSSVFNGDAESSVNYGLGAHFFLKPKLALRWEFRAYRFEAGSGIARRTTNNLALNVGSRFLL